MRKRTFIGTLALIAGAIAAFFQNAETRLRLRDEFRDTGETWKFSMKFTGPKGYDPNRS
jgi:hypothetical protein